MLPCHERKTYRKWEIKTTPCHLFEIKYILTHLKLISSHMCKYILDLKTIQLAIIIQGICVKVQGWIITSHHRSVEASCRSWHSSPNEGMQGTSCSTSCPGITSQLGSVEPCCRTGYSGPSEGLQGTSCAKSCPRHHTDKTWWGLQGLPNARDLDRWRASCLAVELYVVES